MKDLNVSYIPPERLLAYTGNARQHSAAQIAQLVKSIKAFGFMNPVIVDADDHLIAGHGRLIAAKKLGLSNVPVIRVEHLDEAQCRAYMLADNKIAENATWDKDLLRVELEYLMHADINFDTEQIGFSTPEVNLLFEPSREAEPPAVEPPAALEDAVTRPGDLWLLGEHRLLCCDCRDPNAMDRLFRLDTARVVLTDPPYNVPIAGHVSGLGKNHHAEFAMGAGEMSEREFVGFLQQALGSMSSRCSDGALLYAFMDWRHIDQLLAAGRANDLALLNVCVWVKTNAGMGSLYRSQHELVGVFKTGTEPHVNNVELGKHGRYRTNVWSYAGMNTFGSGRDDALAAHPTVKPVAMFRDAIADASRPGEIVLDGFLGSGTTLLAAHQVRRRCYALEIDPRYVDVAVNRWQYLSGGEAVHADSGLSFDELSAQRAGGK